MRIFILEDDRQRNLLFREVAIGLDATFAESYTEAVRKFDPPYDVIFLDHDLGDRIHVHSDDQNTGAAFTRWMPPCPIDAAPVVIVHSYNPDGAETMRKTLEGKGYTTHYIPFGKTILNMIRGFVAADARTEVSHP
jgi:CheY-like chemotaxis protein